jgi:hypothetical protein
MQIEVHLNGCPDAVVMKDDDAELFDSEFKAWLESDRPFQLFEYSHLGHIHCFRMDAVVYLRVKPAHEVEARHGTSSDTHLLYGKSGHHGEAHHAGHRN